MEMKHILIPLLLVGTLPAKADFIQPGGTQQTSCYRNVYREEYVPGNRNNPGYVRRFNDRVRVPCNSSHTTAHGIDNNSCIEGSILGGITGAAAGAALSRDEGLFIGIPLGIVGGALIGCQLDGG